jgi:5-methylcytosine-specific restriction enzyme subunit McrC
VIRRTVQEWKYLPVEPAGRGALTRRHADRLLALARRSPLGGRDGVRILTDLGTRLRAQQVVGVIATEGCTLEILPKIESLGEGDSPATRGAIRRQLVHMLAVALDLEIAAGSMTELDWQRDDLLEILIGLFARKLADAVRRGMPRRYVPCENDLRALRGRLDIRRQFSTLTASPQLLACRFDALSSDIALHRIMKAAVHRLIGISRSAENLRHLRELAFAYADIRTVPVKALAWNEVVLDRTNEQWRDLLSLARLLLGDRFQTTSGGVEQGFSLLFEMNSLFERYVGRLLQRALAGRGLRVTIQGGRAYCLEDEAGRGRFQTKPDILVRRAGEAVLIVDTKWKTISPRLDDPKQGVNQADVYQMMAYARLYRCPRLVLLYPHLDRLGPSPALTRHRIAVEDCRDELNVSSIDVGSHREAQRCIEVLATGI